MLSPLVERPSVDRSHVGGTEKTGLFYHVERPNAPSKFVEIAIGERPVSPRRPNPTVPRLACIDYAGYLQSASPSEEPLNPARARIGRKEAKCRSPKRSIES